MQLCEMLSTSSIRERTFGRTKIRQKEESVEQQASHWKEGKAYVPLDWQIGKISYGRLIEKMSQCQDRHPQSQEQEQDKDALTLGKCLTP